MNRLAYKFKGSGHEVPEEKRKYVVRRYTLLPAFEAWHVYMEKCFEPSMKGDAMVWKWDEYYKKAEEMLKGINATPDEANALQFLSKEHAFTGYFGLFLSAVYNKSKEKTIIFDGDRVCMLGYKLKKSKTLINTGSVDFNSGLKAEGIVVNLGKAGGGFCLASRGIAINLGEVREHFASRSSGIAINYGKADYSMAKAATGIVIAAKEPTNFEKTESAKVLREADIVRYPELGKFLDDLKEKVELAREKKTSLSLHRIKKSIEDILKRTA